MPLENRNMEPGTVLLARRPGKSGPVTSADELVGSAPTRKTP